MAEKGRRVGAEIGESWSKDGAGWHISLFLRGKRAQHSSHAESGSRPHSASAPTANAGECGGMRGNATIRGQGNARGIGDPSDD